MGSAVPKQYLKIGEKTILEHTIAQFELWNAEAEIIVVAAQNWLSQLDELLSLHPKIKVVAGGETRFDSVKNGLSAVTAELVLVHDAVRPLVSLNTIQNTVDLAQVTHAAVPVLEVKFSLRHITFDESEAVDRNLYREVQTPQVFKSNVIKLAYEQPYQETFTDDASVVEAAGHDIALAEGNEENIKITTPFDLKMAKFLLGLSQKSDSL